eukprot:TRINITY_DN20937_c0_g3_i1.p1 TRINITY_DN20937_c0_g3~~TRINITY_DN20937_c0_g3_i1.p1  ORF type:complete len:792 (+),score=219.88 TRINITY_DN20937_c0_g3_i1:179-2554(+)
MPPRRLSQVQRVNGVGEAPSEPAAETGLERQESELSKHSGGSKHSKPSKDAEEQEAMSNDANDQEGSKSKKKKKSSKKQQAADEAGDDPDPGGEAEPEIYVPQRMARHSGFFGNETPEDLLNMGMQVEEAEKLVQSKEYRAYVSMQEKKLEEQIRKRREEAEGQQRTEAGENEIPGQEHRGEDDVSPRSSQGQKDVTVPRGLQRALKQCPIRTKFKPDMRREVEEIRNKQQNAQLAEDMEQFAREHRLRLDGEEETKRDGFFSRFYKASYRQGKILFRTAQDVTYKGKDFMKHENVDETYADLLKQWPPTVKPSEVKRGLGPGAMKAMLRNQDMDHIKDMFGIRRKARQGASDFHQMTNNGQYYCGAMDPNMKKAGVIIDSDSDLSDLLEDLDEEIDEEENVDPTSALRIKSLAEHREEFLVKSKGAAVKRRPPQPHDAVFDFAEARINMPRRIPDNHAGQLVMVVPDLRAGGTEGEILISTSLPRRHCMAAVPNQLDVLLDLKKVQEESKQQPDDPTSSVSRHNPRAPPNVKEWEAWREIQRQKRIKESQAELERARGGGAAIGIPKMDGDGEHADQRQDSKVRLDSKTPKDERAQNFRRAIRQDNLKGLVSEKISAPWDATPPPEVEELEEIFRAVGLEDDELCVLAAGRTPSSDEEEEELTGPVMDHIEFNVKSADVREREPVKFEFKVLMNREDVLFPEKMAWSFDEEAENVEGIQDESAFWGDFLLAMPGSTMMEKLRARIDRAQAKMRNMFLDCQTMVRGNKQPDVVEADKAKTADGKNAAKGKK